jgi:hypothetical protein
MRWDDDNEQRTSKILEGRSYGLYQGAILVFNWRNLSQENQKHDRPNLKIPGRELQLHQL